MDILSILRLIVDFGLCILIWMVQLTVYPAFAYFPKEDLVRWHKKYSIGITIVVAPLMIGQLIIVLFQIIDQKTAYTIISAIIIGLLWLSTFTMFVPLHKQLGNTSFRESVPKKLVTRNWLRTLLWTILAILTITHYTIT